MSTKYIYLYKGDLTETAWKEVCDDLGISTEEAEEIKLTVADYEIVSC